MFNPIKVASGVVAGAVNTAKIAAKAKAYWERAIADTDGDNLPQYENILELLEDIKDRFRPSFGVLKEEFQFYAERGGKLWGLLSALFKHVLEIETPKAVASLEQDSDIA